MTLIISSSYPYKLDTDLTLIIASNSQYAILDTTMSSSWIEHENSYQWVETNSNQGFPTGGGYISIDEEILYYSSASNKAGQDILHVASDGRSLFNSSMSVHISGTRAEMRIIAEYHNRHNDAIKKIEGFVGAHPSGMLTGSPNHDPIDQYNYIDSGSGIMMNGSIEERVRFLEWALIEMFVSGAANTHSVGATTGSDKLKNAIWRI